MAIDPQDFVQRSRVLIARRQYQEAAKICRLGLLAQPTLVEARLVLGLALLALGRSDEVLGEMRVALDMDPRSALGWLLRGEALSLKGDYAQAEKALVRAHELDPASEKPDKLLADIRTALAAGLAGEDSEANNTKEYPNKLRPEDLDLDDETADPPRPETARQGSDETHRTALAGEPVDTTRHPRAAMAELIAATERDPPTRTTVPAPADDGRDPPTRATAMEPAAPTSSDEEDEGEEDTTLGNRLFHDALLHAAEVGDENLEERATSEVSLPPLREDPRGAGAVSERGLGESGRPERADPTERMPPTVVDEAITVEEDEQAVAARVKAQSFSWGLPSGRSEDGTPITIRVPPKRPDETPHTDSVPLLPPEAGRGDDVDLDEEDVELDEEESVEELSAADLEAVDEPPPPIPPAARRRPTLLLGSARLEPPPRPVAAAPPPTPKANKAPPARRLVAAAPIARAELDADEPITTERPPEANANAVDEDALTPPPPPPGFPVRHRPSPTSPTPPVRTSIGLAPRSAPSSAVWLRGTEDSGPPPQRRPGKPLRPGPASPRSRRARDEETPTPPLPRRTMSMYSGDPSAPPHPIGARPLDGDGVDPAEPPPPSITEPMEIGDAPPDPRRLALPPVTPQIHTSARPRGEGTEIVSALEPPLTPSRRSASMRIAKMWPTTRWGLVIAATSAVALIGVVAMITGVVLREWRVRTRVARRFDAARAELATGTYAGYLAAAEEYRRILADRPASDPVRATRARTLAAIAFEFGEPSDTAARAVSALGDDDSEDAQLGRAYMTLARGDVGKARRLADDANQHWSDAASRYVAGRARLLEGHPDEAARLLGQAVDREGGDPLYYHGLGLAETARRRDDSALAAYARALAIAPNHPGSLVDRAVLQIRRGRDLADADAKLETVTGKLAADASPSELARAFLALGRLRLSQGRITAGRALLARAAAKRPTENGELSLDLASAYFDAFDLDAAEAEARRALAVPGWASAAYLLVGKVLLARGHPREALNQVARADARQPETLLVRGLALLALGDVRGARTEIDNGLSLAPDHPDLRAARARVSIAEGNAAQAERDLRRFEGSQPGTARVAEALALAVRKLGQPDRARYWLLKALERNPLAIDARMELASLYRQDGRLDEARGELKRVLEAHPDFVAARRELAGVALEANDPVAAQQEYDALASQRGDDVEALVGSARAHLSLGDVAGAADRIAAAERAGASGEELADLKAQNLLKSHRPSDAVELLWPILPRARRAETVVMAVNASSDAGRPLNPHQLAKLIPPLLRSAPEVLAARARNLGDSGKWQKAEAMANAMVGHGRGVRLAPTVRAEVYAVIGRSALAQNQLKKAEHWLEAAVKLDPRSSRAAYYDGLVLEGEGQRESALAMLEKAVAIDPSFPVAQYELGRLRAQAGDTRANAAFDAYLKLDPDGPYADSARRVLGQPGGAVPPREQRPASTRSRDRHHHHGR